ncbi:MAG: glycosyl hydrolase family 28 protein [Cytophagales bacterium]|nr:glycosyl hydrolase family 28 protein [Cytophagales bacterium]
MKRKRILKSIRASSMVLILALVIDHQTLSNPYNILDFGAKRDTAFLSTSAFNLAINECSRYGGGRVIVPAGDYKSGTIILKDHVELYLEPGATIYASDKHQDFPRQGQQEYRSLKDAAGWYSLIFAAGATNISIAGSGTIDGQGAKQVRRPECLGGDRDGRPRNILFISCKEVTVRGIKLVGSGMWNQHYLNCEDVLVDNIRVYNHSNANNDGIDIDGCRRFILSNSIIDSDDDAICLKSTGQAPCEDIIITNCIASSFCNGIKCGTESTGGFRNINISNCVIKPSINPDRPGGVKFREGITGLSLEIVDGGTMEGVTVNNLMIEGTKCPIYIRLANRARKHRDDAPEPPQGKMRNISISNVTAYNCGNYSSSITGIPGAYIENIQLNNIKIVHKGGLKKGDYLASIEDVKEDIKGYPQPTTWKNLPCCGLFIRHVKGITVNGFSVDALQPDPRPVFLAHDVDQLKINHSVIGKNCSSGKKLITYK